MVAVVVASSSSGSSVRPSLARPRSSSGSSLSVSGFLVRLLRQASIVFRLFLFRFRPLPSALTSLDRFPALSLPLPLPVPDSSSVASSSSGSSARPSLARPRSSSGSSLSVSGFLVRLLHQASIVFQPFLFRFRPPRPSASPGFDRIPALSLLFPASSVCFNKPRSFSGSFSSVSGLFRLL